MKLAWKKQEKALYVPQPVPGYIEVPACNYFVISGEGNPNSEAFSDCIGVLYSLAYAVRMSQKGGFAPENFVEYTVYPLEGVWDLTEKGRKEYNGVLNKDELAFDLMIRQPGFVTPGFAEEIVERTKKKKPHPLLEYAKFLTITDGPSVQMLHLGPYDDEPESFRKMEEYCRERGLERIEKKHREIYLTDARKTAPDRLKTVLRFSVGKALSR